MLGIVFTSNDACHHRHRRHHRYETVTQVQRINATLGLPAALDYRGSVLCQHCAVKNDLPWVVDGYEKIAPSTIYDHEHRGN